MRTQVGIVGAGPAGLMLSHLLHRAGIDSIIVENRSRAYCEERIRAGLIEQWAADMLIETGVGARMQRESMVHDGIHLCFDGALHHIDFQKLVGKRVTIYGQQEVVKDLIAQRLADGGQILFEASDVSVHGFDGQAAEDPLPPRAARRRRSTAISSAAATAFTASAGRAFRTACSTTYEREYPFGWLGILAEAPPVADELIYAYHPRGFALFTHALADAGALLPAMRAGRGPRSTGRTTQSGTSCETRLGGTRHAAARAGGGEDRGADALVRGRADAVRPAVPRRRQRPYRAADRRQGHEPRASPTCACCRARIAEFYRSRRERSAGRAIRRPACGGSGRRSASPGG